ncbi:MAG: DUF2066 domain-containing protein, partial [Gammaproteobacteria bacterium]|nr:DUF2066 domain-containing protein [Gammaproteobacteria bacterium]
MSSLVIAGLLSVHQFVVGAEVQGLYQARVAVSGQQREERKSALRIALKKVLVKVSGDKHVVRSKAINTTLRKPSVFLQQYSYQALPAIPGRTARHGQVLLAQFDPAAVNKALREAGFAIWGKARPSVLLWVAKEVAGKRRLVGAETDPSTVKGIRIKAMERGIPVIFPLLDLEDRKNLQISDVWGEFNDNILAASRRYQNDVVLVARAYRLLPNLWEIRWSLLMNGEVQRWSTQDDPLAMAMDEGIDNALDLLASRFIQTETGSDTS